MLEKIKSVIIGHAIGDALGVPVEFNTRESLLLNPVEDMRGYGRYFVPAGTWSDDTSMTLCAIKSLITGKVDFDDIMENFCAWYYDDAFTATGITFDVGITCADAIKNYCEKGKRPIDCGRCEENKNGNGSIMRINPFVLYVYNRFSLDERIKIIHEASMLTHAHKRSLIGCGIYSFVLWALLDKPCSESIFVGLENARKYYQEEKELIHYNRIFDLNFKNVSSQEINSSGYVVDTLEASLWCLLTTDSYKECLLKAVNLGLDTDTTGAVVGGLAGALYGYDAIPSEWLNILIEKETIDKMCCEFYDTIRKMG